MENTREFLQPVPTEQQLIQKVARAIRIDEELIKRMKAEPRYAKFFTGEGDKNRDMNQLGHALNTYEIANFVTNFDLENKNISPQQSAQIRIASLIHDLGELEKGDIHYNSKTAADDKRERAYFKNNLNNFFPNLNESEYAAVLKIYSEITDKDNDSDEARYFNMIERLGYLRTALEECTSQPKNVDWMALNDNVMHNQGAKLLQYTAQHPSAGAYLKTKIKEIENALAHCSQYESADKMFTAADGEIWRQIMKKLEEI